MLLQQAFHFWKLVISYFNIITRDVSQVPICASTGGLVDTVKEGYTGFHMGAFNVEVCDFTSIVYLYMVHSRLDIN